MLKWLVPLLMMPLFFDGEGGAPGAAGGAPATGGGGANPPQPQGQPEGAKPPAGEPPKSDDELGDKGKAAIKAERDAAKEATKRAEAAEARLAELEAGTSTEHERAIAQAKREAKAEADGKWAAHIRAAEVRGALRAAGVANEKFLGLAMAADEFKALKVNDTTGAVDGVTEAVAKFKEDYPEAFGKAQAGQPGGQWDGGQGGQPGTKPAANLEEAVLAHYQGK